MPQNRLRSIGIALMASFLALPAAATARGRTRPEPPGNAVAVACSGVAPGDSAPLRLEMVESGSWRSTVAWQDSSGSRIP